MDSKRDSQATPAAHGHNGGSVEIAGTEFVFSQVMLDDKTPTGAQIASAAGFKPDQHATVLKFLPNGELEDLRPLEQVSLSAAGPNRFIVVKSDRSLRLTIDGQRYDWPCSVISGAQLRKLGSVDPNKSLFFERQGVADTVVENLQLINLEAAGVEAFYSVLHSWALKVQDILVEFTTPEVVVRDAMVKAGFDVDQEWHIFLKVVGQPKEPVTLATVIDLRRAGIEKLRLTPKDINNGEGATRGRRDFALQEVDESFLDNMHPSWETVREGGHRWMLVYGYPVPAGYNQSTVSLALMVPDTYPGAQIDMFYVFSPLSLVDGRKIPATESFMEIQGRQFQRWSRHRNGATQWKPASDNIITHLALVDDCLAREVGE